MVQATVMHRAPKTCMPALAGGCSAEGMVQATLHVLHTPLTGVLQALADGLGVA